MTWEKLAHPVENPRLEKTATFTQFLPLSPTSHVYKLKSTDFQLGRVRLLTCHLIATEKRGQLSSRGEPSPSSAASLALVLPSKEGEKHVKT